MSIIDETTLVISVDPIDKFSPLVRDMIVSRGWDARTTKYSPNSSVHTDIVLETTCRRHHSSLVRSVALGNLQCQHIVIV